MEQQSIKQLIWLNTANIIILGILAVIYLLDLFPTPVLQVFQLLWIIWLVFSNYKLIVQGYDTLYQFQHQINCILKKNRQKRLPDKLLFINTLTENHKAIIAKQSFFEQQPYAIQDAYELIYQKSKKYLSSAVAFLEQYDFVKMPTASYLIRLQEHSNEMVDKLQELCMDCFLIDDQASDVDISVIDDLLAALKEMQDD